MSSFPNQAGKKSQLAEVMKRLGIRETDLEESFIRSGGPGGQNVNKVSTCVVLKHKPSGLVVRCQRERSQFLNRLRARHLLAIKLDQQIRGHASAEAERISKIRRQKRKRSKRAKDKMLEAKRQRSRTKAARRQVDGEE